MAVPNEVFIVFSFIGFVLCCIPLPWHLEAWNTGTCLYMIWTGLGCLNVFVNAVVWNGDAIVRSPVWCDISARYIIGLAVALPSASLCINRRLYHIAAVRSVTITKAEKRRAIMVDLAIGLGIPILEMILQYIPQGHRFDIFEDVGCYPFTYNTPPAYPLVFGVPLAIGCVSAVYGVLSIRAFAKSRAQFKEMLSGHSNLNTNRYIRLMLLAGCETSLTIPVAIWAICSNIQLGVNPWRGWADTHYNFSRIGQIPAVLWRLDALGHTSIELSRFFTILCAFIFFGFFGFAEEARKNYRSAAQSVAKRVGISTTSSGFSSQLFGSQPFSSTWSKSKNANVSSTGHAASLPVMVERRVVRKHDSLDSLSDMSASFADAGGILGGEKQLRISTLSYDGLVLADVGGTLADFKEAPYSPAPSSGSSSASSISDLEPPSPDVAVVRPDSSCIEISSVRHPSFVGGPDTLSVPALAFDASNPRRLSDTSAV